MRSDVKKHFFSTISTTRTRSIGPYFIGPYFIGPYFIGACSLALSQYVIIYNISLYLHFILRKATAINVLRRRSMKHERSIAKKDEKRRGKDEKDTRKTRKDACFRRSTKLTRQTIDFNSMSV